MSDGIVYGLMVGIYVGVWLGGYVMFRWLGGSTRDFWRHRQ